MEHDERARYVERWARAMEQQGESRIAGRIYGHLVTATEPYLSLQELADQLGVSRASISTNTRRLIATRVIEDYPVPGSRERHFAVAAGGAAHMLDRAAESARLMAELAADGLALQPDSIGPGVQGLRTLHEVYQELAALLERRSNRLAKNRRQA